MKLLSTIDRAKLEQHLNEIGDKLTEKGKKEAQEGQEARPINDFADLATKVFHLDADEETAFAVAGLWRDYYMDGYNTGKAVHSA